MRLPASRGPFSESLTRFLADSGPAPDPSGSCADVLADGDFQLSLWILYELHHHGFDEVADDAEWDPEVLRVRRVLEHDFDAALRDAVSERVDGVEPGEIATQLSTLIARSEGPSIPDFLRRDGTPDQVREVLAHRSVLQLKEADPYTWAIPRLNGASKVALAELQFDEYGDGYPDRLHQTLYARTLREVGLAPEYGAYIDVVSPEMLAVTNAVTYFGLHRSRRGAAMGHLAAFESTSSLPSRDYAIAMRKAGFGDDAAFYFDEHVEADAIHEHLATSGVCGALVEEAPHLAEDVLIGAATSLTLDERFAATLLSAWQDGTWLADPTQLR